MHRILPVFIIGLLFLGCSSPGVSTKVPAEDSWALPVADANFVESIDGRPFVESFYVDAYDDYQRAAYEFRMMNPEPIPPQGVHVQKPNLRNEVKYH